MSKKLKGRGKRSVSNTNGSINGNAKRSKDGCDFNISETLLQQELKDSLKNAWTSNKTKDFELNKSVTLIKDPFNCLIVKNVIHNSSAIEGLTDDLQNLKFMSKNNDLYKFVQSSDLKSKQSSAIEGIRVFLKNQVKPWLEEVTGITLAENVDLFCAKYNYSDYLLCHDDELQGRRIAYIMYFVPPWTTEDGGSLDLFDIDTNGCPKAIVKSIIPTMNTIACFEVTPKSFHQVAEVIAKEKTRLSIGGWFHGTSVTRPPKYVEPRSKLQAPLSISEEDFYNWINPQYLDPFTQSEIQVQFETNSEISLPNFLQPEKYCLVSAALKKVSACENSWKTVGPANKRCIDMLNLTEDDDAEVIECQRIIKSCKEFLNSDATFLLLSNLTGLNLHPLASVDSDENDEAGIAIENEDKADKPHSSCEKVDLNSANMYINNLTATTSERENNDTTRELKCHSKCITSVRRWRQGCYTLLHDNDVELEQQVSDGKGYSLDARLFLNCENWSLDCGGFTSYVAKDEDEELLTASPEDNTLTIVYKDNETLSFIKYVTNEINILLPNGEFHDLAVTYYE